MNNIKPEINPEKVVKVLNDTIQDIKENFDPEKLTATEQERILKEFEELQNYALKVRALFD